jgi:pyridoxal phosphate enzyme (YggS family)
MSDRRSQIARGLAETRERIAQACRAAHRDAADVTLVVVTKTFPASDVRHLVELGVHDVAENRDQEAKAKVAELMDVDVRWQYIGQLQRKKASSVVRWADLITSIDRPELAEACAAAAQRAEIRQDVCVQVNLDPPERAGRGGVAPHDLMALVVDVLAHPTLRLRGLMAVAPYPGDPHLAFAELARLHAQVLALAPEATLLSAGMSQDLEAAIAHGATQVRIGGAILGNRPVVQ